VGGHGGGSFKKMLKKSILAFFSSQSKKRGPVILQGALLHCSNTRVFEQCRHIPMPLNRLLKNEFLAAC
jgi:hypothetical protein